MATSDRTEELSLEELEELTSGHEQPELSQLGPYELHEELGRGAFGVVYRATKHPERLHCALKVLAPTELGTDVPLRRFQREQLVQQTMMHPNIARVFDTGEQQGIHYIATEFLAGGDLRSNAPCRYPRDAWLAAHELFSALAYAHARGLAHRDVKPANVLLTAPDEEQKQHAKLTDFGMAKAFGDASAHQTNLTDRGAVGGTLRMLAPERLQSDREFLPEADMYAAAFTIYFYLTGEYPLETKRPWEKLNLMERVDAVLSAPRVPVRERRAGFDPALASHLDALVAPELVARATTTASLEAAFFGAYIDT